MADSVADIEREGLQLYLALKETFADGLSAAVKR
jgi:hypothetical protein